MNDDNALVRFEFIEILLRIARVKYTDTVEEECLSIAFAKLL